jgi:GTPase SAR1 family protein
MEQFFDVEAFVLVFSITAQQSFHFVISAIGDIEQYYASVPVIVVANKTDLVRTRQVPEEGTHLPY